MNNSFFSYTLRAELSLQFPQNVPVSYISLCNLPTFTRNTFVMSSIANDDVRFFFFRHNIGSIAHMASRPHPRPREWVYLCMYASCISILPRQHVYYYYYLPVFDVRRRSAHQEQLHRDSACGRTYKM